MRRLHAATGLAIVNLSAFGSPSRLRLLDHYLCTHAAVARGRPIVTYFGAMRGAFDSAEIMSGSPSGLDDVESLTADIVSVGDGFLTARQDDDGNAVPSEYDRADLVRVEVQDVVVGDDIKAARRLPVVSIAPSGPST